MPNLAAQAESAASPLASQWVTGSCGVCLCAPCAADTGVLEPEARAICTVSCIKQPGVLLLTELVCSHDILRACSTSAPWGQFCKINALAMRCCIPVKGLDAVACMQEGSLPSCSTSTSLGPPLSPLTARNGPPSTTYAGLPLQEVAWQGMRPESLKSADICARLVAFRHAPHPGQPDTRSVGQGKSRQAGAARQHAKVHVGGMSSAGSQQRDRGSATDTTCLDSQNQLPAEPGESLRGSRPPDSHVLMSKKVLRGLLADLAQGLTDIAQLRQDAMTLRAPLAKSQQPSLQPSLIDSQHDKLPPSHPRTPATSPPEQRCSHTKDTQAPLRPLQHDHSSTSSRVGSQRRNRRSQPSQTAALPQNQRCATSPHMYSYAQPTGHPMVLWQGGLRCGRPLGIQRTSGSMPDAHDAGKRGSMLPACSAGALDHKIDRKKRRASAHTCQRDRVATVQQTLPGPGSAEVHDSERSHYDQQPKTEQLHRASAQVPLHASACLSRAQAAPQPQEEQQADPASNSSPCQHLKQRYLPVYSVFDDRGSTEGGVGGWQHDAQWNASQELPADVSDSYNSAPQCAHPQDAQGRPLHRRGDASDPTQESQENADLATAKAQAPKQHDVEEDVLRAALHAFAEKVS